MKSSSLISWNFALFLGFVLSAGAGWGASHQPAVLDEVVQKVSELKKAGQRPVVVFDLDDTLLSAQERSLRILKKFASEKEIQSKFPAYASQLAALKQSQVRYDLGETLGNLGIKNPEFVKLAKEFWGKNFFTDIYCKDDAPIQGAKEYLERIRQAGGFIVYLTGRDEPRMGQGTRSNLKKNGFVVSSEQSRLMMKPDKNVDDLAFKENVAKEIASLGTVAAVFENEPVNLNILLKAYPEAIGIFLDTIHSPRPDRPDPKSRWVPDFTGSKPIEKKKKAKDAEPAAS